MVAQADMLCLQTYEVAPDVLKEHGKVRDRFGLAQVIRLTLSFVDQEPVPECGRCVR